MLSLKVREVTESMKYNHSTQHTMYLKGNPGLNLFEVPSNVIFTDRLSIPCFFACFFNVIPVRVSVTCALTINEVPQRLVIFSTPSASRGRVISVQPSI